MTTTIQCQFCGNPLELELPPENEPSALDRETIMRLASMTVHNSCAGQMQANMKKVGEDVRLAKAMQTWEMLAPPFYHRTEAWIQTAESKTLNKSKITIALAWVYGSKGAIFYGERSGTGKTSAAYLILKREVIAGKCCAAFTHTDFSRRAVQFVIADRERQGERWIRLLVTCDLLLIDDFGKSRFKTADGTSKQAEELMFDVIDSRITKELPTLLTSNDNATTIRAKMSGDKGGAFLRRLNEFFARVNFDVA